MIGYAFLVAAVVVNLAGYAHSGNPWCAFLAMALAVFGAFVWRRSRG